MSQDEFTHGPHGSEEWSQYPSKVIRPDSVEPVMDLLEEIKTDEEQFEAEQKYIVSILERHNGTAQLPTIAEEMGVPPHELAVPIDLMNQSGVIEVSGSGVQLTLSLIEETL